VDECSQDVVVEVAESQGDAAEVLQATVDGFDGSVGDPDVEVGQDLSASFPQATA